jgi:hypothetical protein
VNSFVTRLTKDATMSDIDVQINGLSKSYISLNNVRIQTHCTTDKVAYIVGESIILGIHFVDGNTKKPVDPTSVATTIFTVTVVL